MTLLALNGSPRIGGNTDLLLQAALEAAATTGAATRLIQLAGLQIAECDGCVACWQPGDCIKQDDMNPLYEQIAQADAIIFGSPVYWYSPTGLMKLLLDRLVYFNCPAHRALVRGKPAGVITPFEEEDPAMADLLLAIFRKSFAYLEMPFAGSVVVPGVSAAGDVLGKPDALDAARDLGRGLVS